MVCKICNHPRQAVFTQKILHKYPVQYYYCEACGFLQTEKPYWLEEAYSDAIAHADTGLVARNLMIVPRLASLLYGLFGKNGRYADFAGGTGLLVRMMRDIGFDYYWRDRYSGNVHARGFEFGADDCSYQAVTAFEVLEHLEDPMAFIEETLALAKTDTLIFTTELYHGKPPAPGAWWYYAPESGQHIAFYQHKTLQTIAGGLGLKFYTASGFHMLTAKNVSPRWYRLAVSGISRLVFPWIRRAVPSKTLEDHDRMLKHGNG